MWQELSSFNNLNLRIKENEEKNVTLYFRPYLRYIEDKLQHFSVPLSFFNYKKRFLIRLLIFNVCRDTLYLTYILTQCHVWRDIHTGWFSLSGEKRPVPEISTNQGAQNQDHHQALHPWQIRFNSEDIYQIIFLIMTWSRVFSSNSCSELRTWKILIL